jgi:hypothetical protein
MSEGLQLSSFVSSGKVVNRLTTKRLSVRVHKASGPRLCGYTNAALTSSPNKEANVAADDSNSLPFVPQLSVEQVLRDLAETERECAAFLFPHRFRPANSRDDEQ